MCPPEGVSIGFFLNARNLRRDQLRSKQADAAAEKAAGGNYRISHCMSHLDIPEEK
jgi:hypothetical protein